MPAPSQPDQKMLEGRTSGVPVCLRLCQCLFVCTCLLACVREYVDRRGKNPTATGDGGAHDFEARARKGQENSFQGQKVWRFLEARRPGDSGLRGERERERETPRPLMHLLRGLTP